MTRDEILARLTHLATSDGDEEIDHIEADKLLLELIGDEEISAAFNAIRKWYS